LFTFVKNSERNQAVVTFSEKIISTDSGFTIGINSSPVTITDLSGSGTDTLTFTIDTDVAYSRIVTIAYDDTAGNAADLADTPISDRFPVVFINGWGWYNDSDPYNIAHTSLQHCELKAQAFWKLLAVIVGWDRD